MPKYLQKIRTAHVSGQILLACKGPHPYSNCHEKRSMDVSILTHPPTSRNVQSWQPKKMKNEKKKKKKASSEKCCTHDH